MRRATAARLYNIPVDADAQLAAQQEEASRLASHRKLFMPIAEESEADEGGWELPPSFVSQSTKQAAANQAAVELTRARQKMSDELHARLNALAPRILKASALGATGIGILRRMLDEVDASATSAGDWEARKLITDLSKTLEQAAGAARLAQTLEALDDKLVKVESEGKANTAAAFLPGKRKLD
jgi:hypothetical protein